MFPFLWTCKWFFTTEPNSVLWLFPFSCFLFLSSSLILFKNHLVNFYLHQEIQQISIYQYMADNFQKLKYIRLSIYFTFLETFLLSLLSSCFAAFLATSYSTTHTSFQSIAWFKHILQKLPKKECMEGVFLDVLLDWK